MRISQIIFIAIIVAIVLKSKDPERMAKALMIEYAICTFWQIVEVIYYGSVQNRLLDNVIALILIPHFYNVLGGRWNESKNKY